MYSKLYYYKKLPHKFFCFVLLYKCTTSCSHRLVLLICRVLLILYQQCPPSHSLPLPPRENFRSVEVIVRPFESVIENRLIRYDLINWMSEQDFVKNLMIQSHERSIKLFSAAYGLLTCMVLFNQSVFMPFLLPAASHLI